MFLLLLLFDSYNGSIGICSVSKLASNNGTDLPILIYPSIIILILGFITTSMIITQYYTQRHVIKSNNIKQPTEGKSTITKRKPRPTLSSDFSGFYDQRDTVVGVNDIQFE